MDAIKLIQSVSNPFLDQLARLISLLGDNNFFTFFFALILWCFNKDFGYRLGISYFSSSSVNSISKNIFRVARVNDPSIRVLEETRGYSFPSGHVQRFTSYIMLFSLNIRKAWMYMLSIFLVIILAISRIYMGAHTVQDVIAAMALGFLWFLIISFVFDYYEKTKSVKIWVGLALLILIGMFIIRENDYYSNAGITLSLICGYLIDIKFIKYETKANNFCQFFKILIGMSGIILISIFARTSFSFEALNIFIRFFLIGVWITVVAPIIFKKAFSEKSKVEVNI